MPLARCHARLHGSTRLWSLPVLLGFVQVVLSMVTACNNSKFVRYHLSILRLDKSFSWLLKLRHCVQYVLSYLTVFRRLLLCPINHHLVDWQDFSQYLRRRYGLARGNNLIASSSACSVIAFSGFWPLYGLLLALALYGPLGPSERFKSLVRWVFPCVKLSGLIC